MKSADLFMAQLTISHLSVVVEDKKIIHNLNLTIKSGEVHALMGPNGSGKSTLAYALMGHPNYKIKDPGSKIKINSTIITEMKSDERAKLGLFLAFQNPLPVAGVPVASLLRMAYSAVKNKPFQAPLPGKFGMKKDNMRKDEFLRLADFHKLLEEKASLLGLDKSFLRRSLNDGFSGGERKKMEMLQALVLEPKFIVFDEIDTGLDVDALKTVAKAIQILQKSGSGIMIITHYQRLLHYIRPDFVHVLTRGEIVRSGDYKLAKMIEKQGYHPLSEKVKVKS